MNLQKRDAKWTLHMTPIAGSGSKLVEMAMSGFEQKIHSIKMRFSGKKSIEITPIEERSHNGFSEDMAKRYFRNTETQN